MSAPRLSSRRPLSGRHALPHLPTARSNPPPVPEPTIAPTRAHQRSPTPTNLSPPATPGTCPRRANINIATLNMRGSTARNQSLVQKWSTVNSTLNKFKIAVLALQETHLDQPSVDTLGSKFGKKMEIIFSSTPESPRESAGVAFIINKSLIAPREASSQELIPGRALLLKLKWLESEETSILNIYAPTDKSSHLVFWNTLSELLRDVNLNPPHLDLMLGDFNVTEDLIDRAPARADNKSASDALRQLRLAWGMQDSWRHTFPTQREFTFRAHTNEHISESRLDRIYTSNRLDNLCFDWLHAPSPVSTDHWLVKVKYAPKDAPHVGPGRWTLPLYALENENLLCEIEKLGLTLQHHLADIHNQNIDREITNPQLLWKDFKHECKAITKKFTQKSFYKINSRISRLEKDRRELTRDPNFDNDDSLRTTEALIANELSHLEIVRSRQKRDKLRSQLSCHGEKLGGIWSAMSKENKPRDYLRRLKIPNTSPPQYERDSPHMAELARDFFNDLQLEDLTLFDSTAQHHQKLSHVLNEIPAPQQLSEPTLTCLSWPVTRSLIREAVHLSKNQSAPGLDGCPYELWKSLILRHDLNPSTPDTPRFDLIGILVQLFTDIQKAGVDPRSNFAKGWMCPAYKKKDKTDIGNYCPITLLNTDYKLFTKILALQLNDHAHTLIHSDQAGFIPRRSIFDLIRLAKAIINYAEITNTDGAIIALDQEKAYDKIRHDYLWTTLEAFHLPEPFIRTMKSLYQHAFTRVAINGFLSSPFQVTRGVQQGDAIRLLGAWIGNKTNDLTPWETIIDKIKKALNFRSKSNPTMHGRKLIIQAIVGGHTQFLTKAQGMPKPIEEVLTKITCEFIWEEDSSPRIALDFLHCPPEEGGLGLLDIKACNEAIDISWLRSYLNFSPSRPTCISKTRISS